jgi:glycosyltransferase involved in cell wall biosynthesis
LIGFACAIANRIGSAEAAAIVAVPASTRRRLTVVFLVSVKGSSLGFFCARGDISNIRALLEKFAVRRDLVNTKATSALASGHATWSLAGHENGPMNILFVHQNYPGQYREILPRLVASGGHRIAFLTQRQITGAPQGHAVVTYKPDHVPKGPGYAYSTWFERTMGNGVGAMKACREIAKRGFTPDLVVGHVGWGEMTFIKEIWPDAPVLGYFEYYFISKGGIVGFDPEFPEAVDIAAKLHARNATNYLAWQRCDGGHTATLWQKLTYPEAFHDTIKVAHEGVRTDLLSPAPAVAIDIGGVRFSPDDEVVTYIARNLEPGRGVHIMLRALPALQTARPKLRLAVIGGDGVSYGASLPDGQTWRSKLMAELGDSVDWSRVHFVGQIPYPSLVALLRLGRAHVYLTAPFVISWSLLETMALGKTVIASDVAPIRPFIENERTGILVDFFSPAALAERIAEVVAHPTNYAEIGEAARRHVLANYDFQRVCYPQVIRVFNSVLPRKQQLAV